MTNPPNNHNYSEVPPAQVPQPGQVQIPQAPNAGLATVIQPGTSKTDLKNAAGQVSKAPSGKKIEAGRPANGKAKEAAPKSNRKLIYSLVFVALLIVPIMPKQVGGEIEIDGTPATNQALLRPSLGGTVKEINVKTGQEVKKGDVIAVIRNWEIEEKVLEAEKQLSRLKASLGPLKAQARVAEQEYQKTKEEFNRQKAESSYIQLQAKGLQENNAAPPRIEQTRKQLEQITLQAQSLSQKAALHKYLSDQGVFPKQSALQTAYEAASAAKQAQALSAQVRAEEAELKERSIEDVSKLNLTSKAASANHERYSSVSEEMKATYAQISGLEKQIELYKEQQNELVLKSPIDGVILTLKTDSLLGQNFNRGDTVAVVGDLSKVKIKLQLPEEERAYTKVGQKVSARFRAVPDQVFSGEVAQIAPVTSETGEQTNRRRIWEIVMELSNPDTTLRPGMTGFAKISTGQTNSLLFLAWDEVYKAFRLDRYVDRNPFSGLIPGLNKKQSN
jgi:multidrug efflux pump subunit AcrA (membrane-fusion protein)